MGSDLIGTGLVDQLNLMIEPILLGGGKRPFPDDGAAIAVELTEASMTSAGDVLLPLATRCHRDR